MMTKKQRDLLEFIQSRLDRDGVPPSFDEMRDALDLRSKSGVHRLITGLEERGFIRRLPHRARAIEILKLPESMENKNRSASMNMGMAAGQSGEQIAFLELPVMGKIAAGVPIEAISQNDRQMSIPADMVSSGNHYALEVRGDSMIEEGIHDGDLVIIREQNTAENGEIIVALIEDQEATLKRFRKKGSAIALEAANPAYETRVYRSDQVKIQGRLVGLIRSYH